MFCLKKVRPVQNRTLKLTKSNTIISSLHISTQLNQKVEKQYPERYPHQGVFLHPEAHTKQQQPKPRHHLQKQTASFHDVKILMI
jgi:hypothetical protein